MNHSTFHQTLRPAAVAASLLLVATLAGADTTKIASEPLITMGAVKPKPNLMVILDDSGSMDRAYMPDEMSGTGRYGYRTAQCSGVAYDPAVTYTPPVYADGSSYPDASFTSAWDDGYVPTGSTTDLGATSSTVVTTSATSMAIGTGTRTFTIANVDKFDSAIFTTGNSIRIARTSQTSRWMTGTVTGWNQGTGALTVNVTDTSYSGTYNNWTVTITTGPTYYTYTGSEAALNWTYDSSGSLITTTDFYRECMSTAGATPGRDVFTAKLVTASSAEATNYANWYSYYRTRRLLMRTAMGQAMNVLGDGYRVGFMQLNRQNRVNGTSRIDFRPVSDFDASQKTDFYASLYAATGTSTTPSRTALSTAGRYFANRLNNQRTDPMQYACQRNFALLTTDGYWNTTNKGVNLSGSAIGNADSGTGAPYQDSYSDTLADVAHYYYSTDLRTTALGNCTSGDSGRDVCANLVPPSGRDIATHQHMTTFTIGMGVNGTLKYDKNYLSQTSGDYYDLTQGTKAWPNPPETGSGGDARNVDDLWHAAVNGRGQYYSAQNAGELAEAIQGVVSAVQETTGAAASASTSVLDLVQGDDNMAFEASYTTGVWTGDVVARTMDAHTAELDDGDPVWSAKEQLDARTAARKIYFNNGSSLAEFTWTNLGGLQSNFTGLCTANVLSQCATLSSANQALVNDGERLVGYLRGTRSDEATAANTTSPLFRVRASRMGDVINSKPIHVGKPPFSYTDAGYSAFKAAQEDRKKVVYVGANDGMLHALDAASGEELWAFIPSEVMPNLYKLADTRYGGTDKPHQYYVDGKTVQGDVYFGGAWHTILVGGLNSGGRAYYALDITDPDNPALLWEFTHNNLGLSYSDPIITKHNGTWVVAFGSGYNNVSPGTGVGRLFMVNAQTGAIVKNLATSAGTATTPSGLAKINVWVRSLSDNTALRFYGGDLLGNVWRFTPDTTASTTGGAVLLLAEMKDAAGNGQPITTELKLREYYQKPIVVVTTGRYLDTDDITDTQTQSIAAIRDPDDGTGWGNIRNNANFEEVTINKSGTTATGAAATVDWNEDGGWRADFPTEGERVNIPSEWDGTTLLVATAVPEGDQCKSGGSSWMYRFGLANGQTNGKQYSDETLIVGFAVVRNDEGDPKILVRESAGKTEVEDGSGLGGGALMKRARRVSWRELIHDRPETN